jgi:4-diphosphocytidyl-2-C-methyl-D-erythritol kinase
MTDHPFLPASRTVCAFAKINLTLDVFSKRADGYHSMASVMQAISLHDTLTLTRREESGIGFTCDAPDDAQIPADATNLVYRAAEATLKAAETAGHHIEGGVDLHLVKRVPAQAGLGGGSSDAASTLLGMNALLEFDLSHTILHACATVLGSDVPFFLLGGTAAARGRGENLKALPDAPPWHLVVVKPEESVSTAWAYNQLDAIPDRASHRATGRLEQALQKDDRDRLLAFQSNDFELPVFAHFPRLAWLHDELMMAGALTAHLCGSGAALYGIAPDAAAAQRVADRLRGRYPYVATARSLTRAESDPLEGNPL